MENRLIKGMNHIAHDDGTHISESTRRKALSAAVVGNILEWYDFAVYGFFATIISKHFFSATDPVTALMATFATFGVGFAARPLGGIVIGRIGDKRGRKYALLLTMFLMAFSTMLIGIIPSYATIGAGATVAIVFARILQGFSAGGEWGGATAFIVEWARPDRRGYFGSFQQCSVAAGLLLGSAVAAVFSTLLSPEDLESWGWRIPFLLGGILGPIGLYMRRTIDETPAFKAVSTADTTEQEQEFDRPAKLAVKAFGFAIGWNVIYYIFLSYMPTFTTNYLKLSRSEALWSNSIGLLVLVVAIPTMGSLSDRIGRKPLLLLCCAIFTFLSYPAFAYLLANPSFGVVIAMQIFFAISIATFSGPGPAAIAEIFPTRIRSTWMSIGYSLAAATFGGFAPFIATWMISKTGTPIAPVYYVIACSFVSGLVILGLRETAHRKLY